ncbi:MAG: hypothetical protein IJS08_10200 [Victivallales bacterium]|nr:hypothetical protein [Victivallales bacterium]
MKQLLRKVFLWDEPAKGAFFAVTLLYVLPRFFWAIVVDIVLPVFLRGGKAQEAVLYFLGALIGGALIYALVVLAHFLPKVSMANKVLAIAACICAVLMLVFWGVAPDGYSRLWWMFPLVLMAFGVAYLFYPAVKAWEWVVAIVTGGVGISVFSSMKSWGLCEVFKGMGIFTQVSGIFRHVEYSVGLQWLLIFVSILLLVTSYLMFARIIAKGGGVPFKSLFGRGVVTLWSLFVVMYLASICLGVAAMRDSQKARKELEAYWGMPVNTKTLVELYAKNDNIDQAFWKELNSLEVTFSEFFRKYDGIDTLTSIPNAVLPPDIYAEWKEAFNSSAELRRSEEMLDAPPPLPERKYSFDYDEFLSELYSRCRSIARLERWRVRLALEEKEIEAAKKALRRFDNLCVPLISDYNEVSGLVWVAIEMMRPSALCDILSSGLADEAWLREQSTLLLEKEQLFSGVQKQMILGSAACMMDTFDKYAEYTATTSIVTQPEAWICLNHEEAVMARCHCISDFADFPEKPEAIFARMLSPAMRNIGTKSSPKLKAALRISRGLIEAELVRLKTGAYPNAMENLPEDPFTGKPLRYAIGEFEVSEEHFQKSNNDDAISLAAVQRLREWMEMPDEYAKELARPKQYTFKTERHKVNAIRIWSVGPDGISGDEVGDDDPQKSRDDIRYFIQRRE